MGVKLKDIITTKTIEFSDLNGKILAVDAFNMLYQFITTIRQPDGSPLTDEKGNTTSHLVGLFYRLTNLMKNNIKLIFVFDGKSPELKTEEKERRIVLKKEAQALFDKAKEEEDLEGMKKYASRTSVLTKEMIDETKEFLEALGIPIIQAPSEGEAQAAYLVKKDDAFAIISQDADSLLFGAPYVVKNLTISQRKKRTNKLGYHKLLPELIRLSDVLNELKITHNQLIVLGMLIGTDYNIGGIKGIGPKNALKLVKEYEDDFDALFEHVKWSEFFDYPWKEVYNLFVNMPKSEDYDLKWKPVDKNKILKILIDRHDFSRERIESVLKDLIDSDSAKQKGLKEFF